MTSLPVVSAGTTLQYLVEHRGTENSPHGAYLVAEGERPVGFLTVASITAVPRERWPVTTTAQAMTSLTGEQAVAPSTDLWSAVQRMEQEEVGQLPVMQQERYVGMLTRDDIISFLRAQQAFRV